MSNNLNGNNKNEKSNHGQQDKDKTKQEPNRQAPRPGQDEKKGGK